MSLTRSSRNEVDTASELFVFWVASGAMKRQRAHECKECTLINVSRVDAAGKYAELWGPSRGLPASFVTSAFPLYSVSVID
jgi:hypothetical protein